jgi:ParB-like chromosome segregation protein Spo0J
MAVAELKELAADIKKNGLRQPIVLYKQWLLDGRNRQEACQLAGVTPTFVEWDEKGTTLDFVLSQNLHRRHLTGDQKREIIARVLRDNPAQSDRSVGQKTDTDHKTVAKVRRRLETGGEIPHQTSRVGADGKAQTVSARVITPPPEPAPKPVSYKLHTPEEANGPEAVLDAKYRAVASLLQGALDKLDLLPASRKAPQDRPAFRDLRAAFKRLLASARRAGVTG